MPQIGIEDAHHAAAKCRSRESCLSDKKNCPCEVEDLLYDMLLFVKPPNDLECMYMLPFGEDFFCVSPMKNEIYERCGSMTQGPETFDAPRP